MADPYEAISRDVSNLLSMIIQNRQAKADALRVQNFQEEQAKLDRNIDLKKIAATKAQTEAAEDYRADKLGLEEDQFTQRKKEYRLSKEAKERSRWLSGAMQGYMSTQVPGFSEGQYWTEGGISPELIAFSQGKFRESDLVDYVLSQAKESNIPYISNLTAEDVYAAYNKEQAGLEQDYGQNIKASLDVPSNLFDLILGRKKNEYWDQNVEEQGDVEFIKNYLRKQGVKPSFIKILLNKMMVDPNATMLTASEESDSEEPLESSGKFGEFIYNTLQRLPGLEGGNQ